MAKITEESFNDLICYQEGVNKINFKENGYYLTAVAMGDKGDIYLTKDGLFYIDFVSLKTIAENAIKDIAGLPYRTFYCLYKLIANGSDTGKVLFIPKKSIKSISQRYYQGMLREKDKTWVIIVTTKESDEYSFIVRDEESCDMWLEHVSKLI